MPTSSGTSESKLYSVLWLALLLTIQSCEHAGDSSQPSGRVGIAYQVPLRCDDAITQWSPPGPDLNTVDPDFEIVGGVAALQTSTSSRYALPAGFRDRYWYEPGSEFRFDPSSEDPTLQTVARGLLLVRRESSFTLRVPEDFHDRVAFEWGSSGVPAHRLEVGSCESETEWLFYFGSVFVSEPECITLEVVLPDSTIEPFQMGIGKPCPGQLPPPEARTYPSPEPTERSNTQ